MNPQIGQIILNKFHLYTGDQSELSTSDELDLLNDKYDIIMSDRHWSFLKTSASGAISVSGGVASIALPSNFRYLTENNLKTDNSETIYNNAAAKVVFVGAAYTPYQVVNYSDRRQYRGNGGNYCYIDLNLKQIIFFVVPADTSYYEFDYIQTWSPITLTTSPIFPAEYHKMLAPMMALDSVIMNLFDRTHSYSNENQALVTERMSALKYWDSMQTFN